MEPLKDLPQVPNAAKWRKKNPRNRFIGKLSEKLCALFVYELAGQEILSIRNDGLEFPAKHLSLLKQSYLKAFYPPPNEKKSLFESVSSWFGAQDKVTKQISELMHHPYFELPDSESEVTENVESDTAHTPAPKPVNFYRCIGQAAACGMHIAKKKRSKVFVSGRRTPQFHAITSSQKGQGLRH